MRTQWKATAGQARALVFMLAAALATSACETGGGKKKPHDKLKDSGDDDSPKAPKEVSGAQASTTRVTVTNSWSNNPLTSQTINLQKAEAELAKYRESKGPLGLEGVVSTARLAHKNISDVMIAANKLAIAGMEKDSRRTIPPEVMLELALGAIQSRNFALALYYLDELRDSKTAHIKAGALNALGVIALHDERVPEAVAYFREALKSVGNYKPALLNLGFSALKGGDLGAAKQALEKLEGDWFVKYGMISIYRMENNLGNTLEACDEVLKKEPGHIATLYNCGLFEYQNKHNIAKAKEFLTKAGKAKGGESDWGEKAFLLISKMDTEVAQGKQEEARRKADEARQKATKAAADKAGADKANDKPKAGAEGAPAAAP